MSDYPAKLDGETTPEWRKRVGAYDNENPPRLNDIPDRGIPKKGESPTVFHTTPVYGLADVLEGMHHQIQRMNYHLRQMTKQIKKLKKRIKKLEKGDEQAR